MPSTTDLFIKYPNPCFIETGTYLGRGIISALRAGFYKIYSIELDETLYAAAKLKFASSSEVEIFHGSSDLILEKLLSDINSPVTFWLDSHYSGPGTAGTLDTCPLVSELEIINRHPIKDHTILIDDRRNFGTHEFNGLSEAEVREILFRINPSYEIFYDYGGKGSEDDVLVATPKKL